MRLGEEVALLGVRHLRPANRQAVAAHDDDQPLPLGGRAVLAGVQHLPLDHVAERLEATASEIRQKTKAKVTAVRANVATKDDIKEAREEFINSVKQLSAVLPFLKK